MGKLYVGTSGFAYPQWKGSFYPAGLSSKRMLEHYASRLNSVEINYTFRRDPTPKMIDGWREQTPEAFRFSIKAPMRITHFWPLDPPQDALDGFDALIRPLGDLLGPVLFQTGPRFAFDRDRLERFLDRLPAGLRPAFEFRHPSWEDARAILADRGAAMVGSETDVAPGPARLTAEPFAYLRLRRTDYNEARLDGWARRIRSLLKTGGDAFVYFKHEEGDAGPAWAASLAERVSGARRAFG
ncbi:MAG: DUF72 domain-containing protein [Actinobacteria bacterium]|nr:DUF72 domain-containing protein [Actinomycetota bacterium]